MRASWRLATDWHEYAQTEAEKRSGGERSGRRIKAMRGMPDVVLAADGGEFGEVQLCFAVIGDHG